MEASNPSPSLPVSRWEATRRAPYWLAAAYVAFAAVQPRDGIPGLSVCVFHSVTGLPCPGCGMTRAITHVFRGDPAGAWRIHPFAFVALPILGALTIVAFLPRKRFDGAVECIQRNKKPLVIATIAFFASLLLFGIARASAVAAGFATFP